MDGEFSISTAPPNALPAMEPPNALFLASVSPEMLTTVKKASMAPPRLFPPPEPPFAVLPVSVLKATAMLATSASMAPPEACCSRTSDGPVADELAVHHREITRRFG